MPFKILIHEYFTGGGWSEPDMPPDIASEGLAMLYAVVDDFRKWGKATVFSTLDKRLSGIPINADNITITDPEEYDENISKSVRQCDFALIIAPESDGILASLNEQMKDNGATLIGCDQEAIRRTGDKWECHKVLSNAGIPVPETIVETDLKPLSTSRYNALENAQKIGFPLVIKPVDGVGCEGVHLIKDMNTLRTVLEYDSSYANGLLLQEYVKGEHLSVSLLTTGKEFVLLSLNRQYIEEGMPFKYSGGEIMSPPDTSDILHNIIKKVLEIIPGLKGYTGIDLIRSEAGYKIIEINPRLTTSYAGIRQVINLNLAEAMFDAVINNKLPESFKIKNKKIFSKEMLID
ncbi:MAG: ATP-grasp domain-containing protein [Desulfobacteraceae bacterium]|jgi:predicted ATP-grasp superfamily ATP-dependent carboligase